MDFATFAKPTYPFIGIRYRTGLSWISHRSAWGRLITAEELRLIHHGFDVFVKRYHDLPALEFRVKCLFA